MSAELVAIGLQIAFTAVSALAFFLFYKREKKEIVEKLNIENIKSEFSELVDDKFNLELIKDEFSELVDEKFNLELLKVEFTEIVDERLQSALDTVGASIQEMFTNPTVKKAFSIIGSQGGEARSQNLAVDEMAKDMLDGPQFAAIRMGAEAMGLDIEGYIEKHGAMKTIQAAQQMAKLANIDIMNLDLGSLALPGAGGSSGNPYVRGYRG